MTLTRQEINRRAAAARRLVLKRLQREQPKIYDAWLGEAYEQLDAEDDRATSGPGGPAGR